MTNTPTNHQRIAILGCGDIGARLAEQLFSHQKQLSPDQKQRSPDQFEVYGLRRSAMIDTPI